MPSDPTASAVDVIAEGCAEGQFWPGVWQQMPEPEREQFRKMAEGALRRAHAAGLAVVPREQVEWQDISTAPRDGTSIELLWDWEPMHVVGYWGKGDAADQQTDRWRVRWNGDAFIGWDDPTHWRPLPAAPSAPPSERAGGGEHG